MKKKHLATLVCLMLLAALFGGCRSENHPSKRNELTIGFSMATLLEDRWLKDRDIFVAKAQQLGITVLVRNANTDSSLQFLQVQELLELGVDILVFVPNDSAQGNPCISAAKEKGVPVVLYDRFVHQSSADVYVSFNNTQVGEVMGEYLLGKAPVGGYILVNGDQSDYNSTMIRNGYMKYLKPRIDSGEISVLAESWIDGWVRENAYDFISEILPHHRNQITAIICANDSLAWGVTDALTEAQLNNVRVVGMDADLSACQRIVRGKQDMTVYKPIRTLAEETLVICLLLADGKPIEQYLLQQDLATKARVAVTTIVEGFYSTPYVAINVVGVTAETMEDTVIFDGFHLREDIYLQP